MHSNNGASVTGSLSMAVIAAVAHGIDVDDVGVGIDVKLLLLHGSLDRVLRLKDLVKLLKLSQGVSKCTRTAHSRSG